ncbi:MAG: TRAM domain-containing protein [Vicinamibacterales bacterium]
MVASGAIIDLDIEKPAAGGRMLARHKGQVALVRGAIPGERVRARVERASRSVIYAETVDVISASVDRREATADWRCGGSVFSHVTYARQVRLKAEIIADAMGRIARAPLGGLPEVIASPEHGYRMRARLHVRDGRVGFFREGTHDVCDASATGQLLPASGLWISAFEELLGRHHLRGVISIEIAENVPADQRACHLELSVGEEPARYEVVASTGALTGLSAQAGDRTTATRVAGTPQVVDIVHVREGDPTSALRLGRDVRAFFQGNRFLLERLVRLVLSLVPVGPVVDLYAGVGLFGLSVAAAGGEGVAVVEGDAVSGGDLDNNAAPFGARVTVHRRSVETFLQSAGRLNDATAIVDPPRTGLSKDALGWLVTAAPRRIVYVSCDVATLARDTRLLLDGGYSLNEMVGIDLFPNTAHVETVAAFSR